MFCKKPQLNNNQTTYQDVQEGQKKKKKKKSQRWTSICRLIGHLFRFMMQVFRLILFYLIWYYIFMFLKEINIKVKQNHIFYGLFGIRLFYWN